MNLIFTESFSKLPFLSFHFYLFFFIFLIIYYILNKYYCHLKPPYIFFGSLYIYYIWEPENILILIATCFLSYLATRIYVETRKNIYINIVIFAIITNLFFSKYLHLILSDFEYGILPLGLSFYSFQTIGCLIDQRRLIDRDPNYKVPKFFTYLSFIVFFPQLISGPIEKYNILARQLEEQCKLTFKLVSGSIYLVVIGLFIKINISGELNDVVYLIEAKYPNINLLDFSLFLTYLSFYIYSDFLSYSLIALGLGRALSVRLSFNFNKPYFSTSLSEFWRRWHITLGEFLREYIYKKIKRYGDGYFFILIATLFTFALSGAWHGGGINFMLWGVANGLIVVLEKIAKKNTSESFRGKFHGFFLMKCGCWLYTFSLVSVLWIVFFYSNFIRFFVYPTNNEWLGLGFHINSLFCVLFIIIFDLFNGSRINLDKRAANIFLAISIFGLIYNFYLGGVPGEFIYFRF